jgi:hypothetical protein
MSSFKHDKNGLSKLLIVIVVVIIAVVAVSAVLLLNAANNNKVKITVECTGTSWTGAYGDSSGVSTWTGGAGTKSVVIERPANTAEWTVVANAIMIGGSGSVTVAISKMDGTVLDEATASGPFALAQAQAKL